MAAASSAAEEVLLGPHVLRVLRPAVQEHEQREQREPQERRRPQPAEPPCACFVLHGRGSSADTPYTASLCARVRDALAERGPATYVVAFDAANHGRRTVDAARNAAWADGNRAHAVDMYAQMVEAAQAVSLALDLLPAALGLPHASFRAAAVVGVSQGGHAALLVAANEPRVTVCVSFIGCPDCEGLMRGRYAASDLARLGEPPPAFADLFPPALAALARRMDATHRVEDLRRKAVCMLSGDDDALVPKAFSEDLARSLAVAGAGPRCSFRSFAGVAHAVSEDMLAEGLAFLARWLPVDAAAAAAVEAGVSARAPAQL